MGPYAWGDKEIAGFDVMRLLVFYIVFVAVGQGIAYLLGRAVEHWSEAASLPVFLTCFFFMLWGAWRLAVRVT
jgi:hypothetical protein